MTKRAKTSPWIAVAILVSLLVSRPVFAQSKTVDYPLVGVQLALGWNSLRAEPADDICIDFGKAFETAQIVSVGVSEFKSKETLHRKTNVSVEFSAKAIAGIGVSLKSRFLSEYDSSVDEQSYAVQATVENEAETAGPSAIGPLALKAIYVTLLKSPDGLAKFQKVCGDSFVYRRTGGAELTALATLYSTTRESKDHLGFSLDASGINLTAKGAMDAEDDSTSAYSAARFDYLLVGGSGATGAFDKVSINQLLASLPTLAKTAPKYLTIELRRYDSLSNWPSIGGPDAKDRNLEVAVRQHLRLSEVEKVVVDATVNSQKYIPDSLLQFQLKALDADLRPKISNLKSLIASCLSDAAACENLPTVDDIDYYAIYSLLPLRWGSTLYDKKFTKAVDAARTALDSANNSLNRIRAKYNASITCEFLVNPPPPPPGGGAVVPGPGEPSDIADTRNQCKAFYAADQRVKEILPGAEAALRESLFQIWIADISKENCDLDFESHLCLSVAQLDEWRRVLRQSLRVECDSLLARVANAPRIIVGSSDPHSVAMVAKEIELLKAEAQSLADRTGVSCAGQVPKSAAVAQK